ncbi:PAS domain-containing protein [Oceaniglobus roseus]|uniref:PAS domain-containing protein n=1 Tax=Oceaniglobus roseus TaxID=1737570 RepID=UPI000C7F2418|nr:PAS domain-containing protein [Kandeliimicrobium roseum]
MGEGSDELIAVAIQRTPVAIVLTDARDDDHRITFVNDAFQAMTLYSRDYAVGRNCRFLQGRGTEPEAVLKIREGLRSQAEFQVTLTNYKADGTPFTNQVLISPVFDRQGDLTAFFSVQREMNGEAAAAHRNEDALNLLRELQHRVKNHLAMVVGMIRIQARATVTEESFRAVGRRVEALALLYEEMFAATQSGGDNRKIRTGAYLSRIASVVSRLGDRSAIRLNVDCEEIELPIDQAARLGLLLSELLTNAFEHAFAGRDSGLIEVRFHRLDTGGVRLSVADDGVGLPEGIDWPGEAPTVETQTEHAETVSGELDTTGHCGHSGVGGSIVTGLTEMLGADLQVTRAAQGTIIAVEFEKAE